MTTSTGSVRCLDLLHETDLLSRYLKMLLVAVEQARGGGMMHASHDNKGDRMVLT